MADLSYWLSCSGTASPNHSYLWYWIAVCILEEHV